MQLITNENFNEISLNEMEDINGGVAPLVILGAKILIGGVAGGAGWALGEWVASKF